MKSASTQAGLLVVLLAAVPALAQEGASDFWQRDTLTGDWGGLRTTLAEQGVTFTLKYTSDLQANVAGGIRRGTVYDGLFLDKINANNVKSIPSCSNPCLKDARERVYPDQASGQLEYIRRMRDYFKNVLGADGVAGNTWRIFLYAERQKVAPLDLLYSESGKDLDPATWGGIPPGVVSLQLPQALEGDSPSIKCCLEYV